MPSQSCSAWRARRPTKPERRRRPLDLLAVYGEDDPVGSKRITHRITQQQLAEQIGATRESVSRALIGLRDVQALRLDGRTLVVLSEKRLRRACSR